MTDDARTDPAARSRKGRGRRQGGRGETPMVDDVEFASYYNQPVLKPPPWGSEVAAYLFLGGLAAGSGLLGLGAQLTGRARLRRNARLTALGATGAGTVALVMDLGRPERFLHMLRTVKPTSPMNLGSWILTGFGAGAGAAAAGEIDRLTGDRLPLGPLRRVLRVMEPVAGLEMGALSAPLAAYTAVLLSDTANPTWNAARHGLPYVFVSSASIAAGGAAMITTPTGEAKPARILSVLGAAGDVVATRLMKRSMHPAVVEPLETGGPGRKLAWSERLAIAGGIGALIAGRWRPAAIASGLMLLGASALNRFGVLEAGIESTKDPRRTVQPQRERLEERRAAGIVDDSITTA